MLIKRSKAFKAHQHSSLHRKSILKSKECGCFYCLKTYPPSEIVDWCDEDKTDLGQTAICPNCGIDSVIGDFDIKFDSDLLKEMYTEWFSSVGKQEVVAKYKGKVLALTLYMNGRGPYYVGDFINFNLLESRILSEIDCGESDITPDGINFLKDYYGFGDLAEILFSNKWYGYESKKEILKFLENMSPFVGANFISNVRNAADMEKDLKDDPNKFKEVRVAIEGILSGLPELDDYYKGLEEEQKVKFILRSHHITFSMPNDEKNFISNLEQEIVDKIKRPILIEYANRLFAHFQPKDSFPVDKENT